MTDSCQNCSYWEQEEGTRYLAIETGYCSRSMQLWDASEYGRISNAEVQLVLTEEAKTVKMFVPDGSDYRASLITTPDFYCIEFKAKEEN